MPKISKRTILSPHNIFCVSVLVLFLFISGCGDFFEEKSSELESQRILSEISRIKVTADPNQPRPRIYTQPSKIIIGKDNSKVFYFARHHTVDKLHNIIKEQLGYKVSSSAATNLLIIQAPNKSAADMVLDFMEHIDVPPIQVKIDCIVSELYADTTMDWETTIKIDNLLGGIALGGKTVAGILQPAFPGASLRDEARELIGLKVGYSRNLGIAGHEFRALVDILVSRGYLKILMNPILEVVNGKTAMIVTEDHVPLPKEVTPETGVPYMTTEYVIVKDMLKITPHVYADGYIGLETEIIIGSKSTPEGVKQIPIITERKIINKENRIKQGQSLIIGGIRKTEKRSVIRGVPLLKDIPLVGVLFSSKDFEERGKEILFIITPTISSGSVDYEEMITKIKHKHTEIRYKRNLKDILSDPLGSRIQTDLIKQQAEKARLDKLRSDIEKEQALVDLELAKTKLQLAKEETKKAKIETEEAKKQTKQAKEQTKKAQEDTKRAKKQAEAALESQKKD